MHLVRIPLRNAFRHKLRACLTIIGIAVAVLAFGVLRTLIAAWYAGAEGSSANRLVTRNAISLVFPLPISYKDKITRIPGITSVTYGNWFGGIYKDRKNFFPNFAVEPKSYLALYPEYLIPDDQKQAFLKDRRSFAAGKKLVDKFGWRVGDKVVLNGTIFPGEWEFVLRAVYRGKYESTDETQFFFHYDYMNEALKRTNPRRADHVGFYIEGIKDPDSAPAIARTIDETFKNSLGETLTETEKAFQMGFIAMTEAIVIAVQIVSYIVIVIIMVVAANTMAMNVRERLSEFATMKTLGFGPWHIAGFIAGESLFIALAGGVLGAVSTFPAAKILGAKLGTYFPSFIVTPEIILFELAAALIVGLVSALLPAWRASTVRIAVGLRRIG